MDEPLSNLDAKLRASMRAEIKRLHRHLAATIVYVTHDQTEAMTLGDRIAVMRAGDLLQCDTPAAIYERPSCAFVATFIGLPQMNLLPATLSGALVEVPGASFRLAWHAQHHPHRGAAQQTGTPREVHVGIRPEHLTLERGYGGSHDGGAAVFAGTVELAETTGADTFLHLTTAAGELVARISGHAPPRPGERLRVRADVANVHLFDRATGARIG
jgi:multiple sugar transport system ATP-binding protein